MKVGIVCPYNIFKAGGVQEHVAYQASILRSRGHDVTIITPKPRGHKDSAPAGVVFIGGSTRIKTPSATSGDLSLSVYHLVLNNELAKGYDVIHVHEPAVPLLARQILPKVDCLRVGTFHAALPGNTLGKTLVSSYKVYFKTVLPYMDVITAVSPAAIGYIKNSVDLDKIEFIPNGINLKLYKPRKVKRDKNMVLFIGRLEKRKGALQAIKAFGHLKSWRPKARLLIGGDGPLKASLMRYVNENSIQDVEFLGFIEDSVKLDLLSRCGVYTSPALYGESFGIVLAEAMAMQAPIVCHPNDGYKWVMQGTGQLSLVNCEDAREYAEKLNLMLEDELLRTTWQKWSVDYVKQFDYEKVVDRYEALYEKHLKVQPKKLQA